MPEPRSDRIRVAATVATLLVLLLLFAAYTGLGGDVEAAGRPSAPITPVERSSPVFALPVAAPSSPTPLRVEPFEASSAPPDRPEPTALAAADAQPALRVVDVDGEPVPQALAYPSRQPPTAWAHGDDHGLIPLPAPSAWDSDPLALRVGAFGYERTQIELVSTGPWPREVVLEPATILDITIEVPEAEQQEVMPGEPPNEMYVSLTASEFMFESEVEDADHGAAYRSLTGDRRSGPMMIMHDPGGMGTMQVFSGLGRHRIRGARPGHPILVQALGSTFAPFDSEEVVLRPGEHRVVTFVADDPIRSLGGRVLDAAGRVLSGVTVQLRSTEDPILSLIMGRTSLTDDAGRYDFSTLGAQMVQLTVQVDGMARHERELDTTVTSVHDIVLQPAPHFVLRVLQQHSLRPVRLANVRDEWGPWQFPWDQTAPGEFTPQGLPPRAVVIQVRHRGTDYQVEYTPGDLEAECLIPEMGAVVVHGLSKPSSHATYALHFTDPASDSTVFTAEVHSAGTLLVDEVPPGDYGITLQERHIRTDAKTLLAQGTATVSAGATVHAVLVEGP